MRPVGRRSVAAVASPVRTASSKADKRDKQKAAKDAKDLIEKAKGVEILDDSEGDELAPMDADGGESAADTAALGFPSAAAAVPSAEVDLTGEDL